MPLPIPPTLEELKAYTPTIGKVPAGIRRPFWSVMIPTYNSGSYLQRTLESVLCQDPGPDEMQIEVVDGCSTKDDPEKITSALGSGRVAFSRLKSNHGPAHTFNTCIERSAGRWVHILHGDDMILPGFYDAYATAIRAHPEARAVFGQAVTVDEDGRWIGLYGVMPPVGGGILGDFVAKQATRQLVLFPGVVVRRDAYEAIGGFCTFFTFVTDWDMWFRLGQFAPVAWMPRPYGLCRIHGASVTSQSMISASNIQERYALVNVNIARLNGKISAIDERTWRSKLAKEAEETAWDLDKKNCVEGRYNQVKWAWLLEPTARRTFVFFKSWLKLKLSDLQTD
jgi:glycosyltransferase involved in cell wall biosynthesis